MGTATATTTTTSRTVAGSSSLLAPAVHAHTLRRAPSLQEVVDTMRTQNPDRWKSIAERNGAGADAGSSTAAAAAAGTAGPSSAGTGASSLLGAAAASTAGTASSGAFLDAPRLRLPARLGGNLTAAAPLTLSRSVSSHAIVQSVPASSSSIRAPINEHTAVTSGAGSGTTSGTPATSVRKGGLPSLEVIEKRFASKLGKEVTNGASDTVSSPTDKYAPTPGNKELSPLGESSSAMARSKSEGSSPAPAMTAEGATVIPFNGKDDAAAAAAAAAEASTMSTEKTSPDKSTLEGGPANANADVRSAATASPSSTSSALPAGAGANSEEYPLQHDWTLYYDSRATARAAQLAQLAVAGKAQAQARAEAAAAGGGAPETPVSAAVPAHSKDNGGSGSGSGTAYEAGLTAIGTFATVQAFCRLHNWTKRPSRMGLNENVHLFKDGIRPMWEDERNKHGGKWVLQVENGRKEEIDRFWTWLCLALVGEDFEERNDEICGAVFSTRPRFYRIQLWLRNKDDVTSINAIGQRLLRVLELEPASGSGSSASTTPAVTPTSGTFSKAGPGAGSAGISLEFAYHSKGAPPHGRFITFSAPHAPVAAPGPSSTSAQGFAGAGSAFGAFGPAPGHGHAAAAHGGKILTPASSFHRPPGLGAGGGMARTVSMGALGGHAGGFGHAHGHGHGHGSTHGGSSLKSGFTVTDANKSQQGGVTQNTPPAPGPAPLAASGTAGEAQGKVPSWRERLGQPAKQRPLAAT